MSREDEARWLVWTLLAFKAFCAAIVVAATFFTIYAVGPSFETRYFPVTEKLKIVTLSSDVRENSVLMTEFNKVRNCEFVGIAWFRGHPHDGFMRVPIELRREAGDNSSPNRPMGRQRSGPWIVGIPPEELPINSFALLYHRCHAFWLTTTEFYP